MANQDAAFGLRPIGKVGSNRDSGGLTEYEIAACASAIYQNDCVKASGAGIAIAAATDNGKLLGSLQGIYYTDATTNLLITWQQVIQQLTLKAMLQMIRSNCMKYNRTILVPLLKETLERTRI